MGGRRKTTWDKNTNPRKAKGTKHKKTILKEQIGVGSWETLRRYIQGNGAQKMVKEMQKLKGKDFSFAFHQVTEYFMPKLQRVDAKIKAVVNLSDEPITFE